LTWFYTRHNFLQARLCFGKWAWTTKTPTPRTCQNLCRKLTLLKSYFARKNEPGEKPELNLPKLLQKTLKPILQTWLCPKKRKPWKTDFEKWNCLLAKTLHKNLEPDFRDLSKFDSKLFEPKTWTDFQETKTWKITAAKNAWLYWNRNFAKNQNPDLQDAKRQFETQLNFWNCLKDLTQVLANGLRYPRWGGRRDAVRLEKGWGVGKGLKMPPNPQRRVHALLGCCWPRRLPPKDDDADFTRTLLLTKVPKPYANQNACWKTDFLPIKTPN